METGFVSEKAVNSAQDVQDAFRKFFHPVSKQLIFHLWGNQEPDPLLQHHPLLHLDHAHTILSRDSSPS